ncbi:succinate dehydrogenase, cytochrome b556 subunit [Candidatus Thiothrix sp. Deng01]|uniref:Succinate dehydrogenase cytochrome b556 subunit n=2 Tax=Thiothrix TaxID=1030 RepID=A0A7L6APY3_9GAMM|nr:succinate dehydrogenase, cytochrome b556 subunit [Candidatus Thiothrix sp. Deng01]MEB4591878.1 succinate dehydrogenase, cytochrome b556 subunit [Candidatus Thiothrix sp. Deng01]QLQ31175.1 MAG: succinate dehydrogenase, cytochrome b556 subunit [Candidatus Thiothrix singaporensis]
MKNASNRPLSPHLQIYKLPLTGILSITHRATGVVLAIGTLLVTYWLAAIAGGEESFNSANAILGSWFGKLVLFGWTWALFYHLSNGVRHLLWDIGFGFDIPTANLTSKIVVGASFVLTILLWIIA